MSQENQSPRSRLIRARVTVAEGIRDAANQDGAVLLDIDQGRCLSLNVVGARIWEMLKKNQSGEEIIYSLAREFTDVSRSVLEQDYVDFIQSLESNKLAHVAGVPTVRAAWNAPSPPARKRA